MAEIVKLSAGPLQAELRNGELWHVRLGNHQAVERIYGAIRDRNWITVQGSIENLMIRREARSFRVEYDSIYRERETDFRWHATITGEATGRISFAFDGKAQAAFLRNRIGLSAHLPLRECAGQRCEVETIRGATREMSFPVSISANQIFLDVRALRFEIGGAKVEMRLTGETFEVEDQRNWSDANFKIYGTPLHLPFPVEIRPGTEIHQRIEVALQEPVESLEESAETAVRVCANSRALAPPKIGLVWPSEAALLSLTEIELLRKLRLAHIRVDIRLQTDFSDVLKRAASVAEAIGAGLEVAVKLPGDPLALRPWRDIAVRWLILLEGKKATGSHEAAQFRAALGDQAVLAVGTDAYFSELNRNRPDGPAWDAVCYPVTPQVHARDEESVMANSAVLGEQVRCAKLFAPGKGVAVSPVTLRPRYIVDATAELSAPEPDPRQKLQFCAAWTFASFCALAETSATSVTYYQTHGSSGIMEHNAAFPVYQVFQHVCGAASFAGCDVSEPGRIAALAIRSGDAPRYLIANLTPQPCEVQIESGAPTVLQPYQFTEARYWRH
jgi:hypothetical protein